VGTGRRSLTELMRSGDPAAWFGYRPRHMATDQILTHWKQALSERGSSSPPTVQLYVHFAYCRSSCSFCQYFHSVPNEVEQFSALADHLSGLARRYGEALGPTVATNAYFGGGTPTALPTDLLARFLRAFSGTFRVEGEFSCEGHPATLDQEKIALLADAGVNRMSMGIQSLDAEVLRVIRRGNRPLDIMHELVDAAQRRDIEVNVDLVLGLPKQTPASFREDIKRVAAIGADSITIYRFMPVPGMSDPPDAALRFSRIFDLSLIAELMAVGYVGRMGRGDDASGVKLWRNTSRVRRWLVRSVLLPAARRLVRRNAPLGTYSCFDQPRAHLLGLGPGALSHIYGRAWYREVTALGTLGSGSGPVYWGSPLSEEDELRTVLLRDLGRGSWVDIESPRTEVGERATSTIMSELKEGVRSGALEKRGRRGRLNERAPEKARETLLERLTPERDHGAGGAADAGRKALAFRMRKDVEARLVEIDTGLSDAVDPPACQQTGTSGAPAASAVAEWCRHVGLSAVGETFAGARVEKILPGEIHFRWAPKPARPLRIAIGWAGSGPSYVETARFTISYLVGPGEEPLEARELALLNALCARTRTMDHG
jgi:oxygen-independent coproporphyrinogen III oxidase